MKKLHRFIVNGTLIGKYLSGAKSGDHLWAEVKRWLDEDPQNYKIYKELQSEEKLAGALDEFDLFNEEKAWSRFTSSRTYSLKKHYRQWLNIAAVLLIFVGISSVLIYHFSGKEQTKSIAKLNEIKPGEPKAYLELTNGSVVSLSELNDLQKKNLKNSTGFDVIGNTVIVRKSVTPVKKENKPQSLFNTLVIPKGGEYKLVLEDSTEIWLNADSKLKFPQKFGSGVRSVELVGEAYFKVKKDEHHPFVVRVNNINVKVLGTEFNVSAYLNDPSIKTTLVSGQVCINYKTQSNSVKQNLVPGEQASYRKEENSMLVEKVDVVKFISWKDGYFVFDNQPLSDITKILERWYNVDFVIQDEGIKNARFSGQILRYDNINVVFDLFRKTGTKIKFIEEGRIIRINY